MCCGDSNQPVPVYSLCVGLAFVAAVLQVLMEPGLSMVLLDAESCIGAVDGLQIADQHSSKPQDIKLARNPAPETVRRL